MRCVYWIRKVYWITPSQCTRLFMVGLSTCMPISDSPSGMNSCLQASVPSELDELQSCVSPTSIAALLRRTLSSVLLRPAGTWYQNSRHDSSDVLKRSLSSRPSPEGLSTESSSVRWYSPETGIREKEITA